MNNSINMKLWDFADEFKNNLKHFVFITTDFECAIKIYTRYTEDDSEMLEVMEY